METNTFSAGISQIVWFSTAPLISDLAIKYISGTYGLDSVIVALFWTLALSVIITIGYLGWKTQASYGRYGAATEIGPKGKLLLLSTDALARIWLLALLHDVCRLYAVFNLPMFEYVCITQLDQPLSVVISMLVPSHPVQFENAEQRFKRKRWRPDQGILAIATFAVLVLLAVLNFDGSSISLTNNLYGVIAAALSRVARVAMGYIHENLVGSATREDPSIVENTPVAHQIRLGTIFHSGLYTTEVLGLNVASTTESKLIGQCIVGFLGAVIASVIMWGDYMGSSLWDASYMMYLGLCAVAIQIVSFPAANAFTIMRMSVTTYIARNLFLFFASLFVINQIFNEEVGFIRLLLLFSYGTLFSLRHFLDVKEAGRTEKETQLEQVRFAVWELSKAERAVLQSAKDTLSISEFQHLVIETVCQRGQNLGVRRRKTKGGGGALDGDGSGMDGEEGEEAGLVEAGQAQTTRSGAVWTSVDRK
jgi:hypothetical protein